MKTQACRQSWATVPTALSLGTMPEAWRRRPRCSGDLSTLIFTSFCACVYQSMVPSHSAGPLWGFLSLAQGPGP